VTPLRLGAWAMLAFAACKPEAETNPISDAAAVSAHSIAAVVPSAPMAPASPPSAAPRAAAALPSLLRDASASSCRAIRGPVELPIRGPAALVVRSERIDAVLDEDGRARVASFLTGPIASASAAPAIREGSDSGAIGVSAIPCATTGDVAFCPDRSGAVHRAKLTGEGDRIIASSRRGTRVAAGAIGAAHAALGYLASRQTSEGWVSEAWVAVDDDPPVRLSEDGSGATAIDLAPHGSSLLALTVDARAALTAMHARPVAYEGGVRFGEDAVVFVGGPGDRRTAAVLALPATGPGWALLPISRDMSDFGLALVRLDDPPRVDEPVVWSMYPNGLDPAPVAAAPGNGRTWVARVRPRAAAGTLRDLELGEVDAEGGFVPRDIVPTADSPSDVSLAIDGRGALWIAWLDSSGSWLERFACR
jgi:hypothetical protein